MMEANHETLSVTTGPESSTQMVGWAAILHDAVMISDLQQRPTDIRLQGAWQSKRCILWIVLDLESARLIQHIPLAQLGIAVDF